LYSFEKTDSGFAQSMMQALNQGKVVQAFRDEIRPPAHVEDVARALVALAGSNNFTSMQPIVHLGGPEALTRYDMALQLAVQLAGATTAAGGATSDSLTALVKPMLQSEVETGVARPARLWLESSATWVQLGIRPRTWAMALATV
jgi:dTDP-4-dehydrorhamnose reductase